jgi:hypothetical protein
MPTEPVLQLLALKLGPENWQILPLAVDAAIGEGAVEDLQVMELAQVVLGLPQLFHSGQARGIAPALEVFEGIAGGLDPLSQPVLCLSRRLSHAPAGMEKVRR